MISLTLSIGCSFETKFDDIKDVAVLECTADNNAFDIEDVSTRQESMSESIGTWIQLY